MAIAAIVYRRVLVAVQELPLQRNDKFRRLQVVFGGVKQETREILDCQPLQML